MAHNVAVDVGGTFTDVLIFDEESGGLTEGKVLTTPDDPSKGVVEGIEAVCGKVGISFPDLHLFFHGTTVVTNMILTNTGSRVGLLTTKGHEQILHLARAWTPGPLYGWMALQKPDPPADPTDTVGITERISAAGEVLVELDENEVRESVERLVDRGVESLAIGFLNSYVNPSHERRARDIVREAYPDLSVSISADIGQEYGEYERTLTTVVNTAVQPRTMLYMRKFERSIDEKRFGGSLSIVRSDGGAMSTEAVAESPIQIALSGPSGGVTGSAYLARDGEAPTVTDANVVLHRIPPGVALGGTLEMDEEAAKEAVGTITEQLGMGVEQAAEAILAVVNENMHAALRVVSVERGHDPRNFGLVAFGGAGAVHPNPPGGPNPPPPPII